MTIEIMKAAATLLTNGMQYQVPAQELRFSLARMPTVPNSGFVINKVIRGQYPQPELA